MNKPTDTFESRGLTLVTLCDMVLGENSDDRTDSALIRAVGSVMNKRRNSIEAKISILSKQIAAKKQAAAHMERETNQNWFQGYACGLEDGVKVLQSLLKELENENNT